MQLTELNSKLSPLFIFCLVLVHYVFNYVFVHFAQHSQSLAHTHTLSRKKVLIVEKKFYCHAHSSIPVLFRLRLHLRPGLLST